MRYLIFTILILTLIGTASADLIVNGTKTTYQLQGKTLTEGDTAPANATEGEQFRNVTDNQLYTYHSGNWTLNNIDANITQAIADFKTEVAQITDIHAKKAITALSKAVLKLYKE